MTDRIFILQHALSELEIPAGTPRICAVIAKVCGGIALIASIALLPLTCLYALDAWLCAPTKTDHRLI